MEWKISLFQIKLFLSWKSEVCAFSGRGDWVAHLYCKLIIPSSGKHRKNFEGVNMQKLDAINSGELYDEPLSLMKCAKNRRIHETAIQKTT